MRWWPRWGVALLESLEEPFDLTERDLDRPYLDLEMPVVTICSGISDSQSSNGSNDYD